MTISIDGTLRRGDWSIELGRLVFDGGVTAITGPNGAGKTSLLRLVAGLEALHQGKVVIDDTVVDDPAAGTFVACHRRPIAMVFQDLRLFEHLRVIDNVAFPLRRRGASRHAARNRAADHLSAVGLPEAADSHPSDLSGGQRQRVAMARALATEADILLLDEPLSSVDEASKPDLRQLLTAGQFRTVIWVTHAQHDALAADRVIEMSSAGIARDY